jgi:E-phenylitaconyl-CoA hydratase
VPESRGLRAERDGPVAILTIDRPDRGNALDTAFHDALHAEYESIKKDRSVRAIVLTGQGDRFFCTGQDLRETADAGGPGQRNRVVSADVQEAQRATPIRHDIWLPFIVAVNGVCAGAGLHFVCDADIVLASSNASFIDTHCAVGQVSVLEPINLLHRVGAGDLLRLIVLGREGRIGAEEARRISLVNDVVPQQELLTRAVELAHATTKNSPAAMEASKRALWAATRDPMRQQLQYGWDLLRAHWAHPDSVEGARAFVEKRPAVWRD